MTEGGASTAGTLQGYLVVGHCRDTWWLGTTGTLGGWACRDTRWLGTAGTLGGWALQGQLVVGHYRDTWWLGTAGTLGGWALKSASSRASTTSSLKSNNPTVRVGNKRDSYAKTSSIGLSSMNCKFAVIGLILEVYHAGTEILGHRRNKQVRFFVSSWFCD